MVPHLPFRLARAERRAAMNLSKSTIEIIGLLLACGLWLTSAASAQTTTWTAMRRSVVVSIPDRELAVIENGKVIRTFRVAVGAPVSPSPTGEVRVVNRVPNPTYYHAGGVMPAGAANAIGPRWIGRDQKR